jgi:DNA-binding NarL/FixJ family response regulator
LKHLNKCLYMQKELTVSAHNLQNNNQVKEEYNILIVDDHKIFREGLSFVISQMSGFKVIGAASNGHDFLNMIDDLDVDIVLMDISMPGINGIDATAKALEKHHDLKVIALSMFCDREYYYKMIQAGASGYILKDSGREELLKALNTVVNGEKYFSQKLLHSLIMGSNSSSASSDTTAPKNTQLTPGETEILKLICQGHSNLEISKKLSLSIRIIDGFKSDLMAKTGVKNSVGLAVYALKNHLLDN